MKLHQEPEIVQIATLLTVIGAKPRKVFSTFTFIDGNRERMQKDHKPLKFIFQKELYVEPKRLNALEVAEVRERSALYKCK